MLNKQESAYHHQVWKRYKRQLEHDDYATQLKNIVVKFGKNDLKYYFVIVNFKIDITFIFILYNYISKNFETKLKSSQRVMRVPRDLVMIFTNILIK